MILSLVLMPTHRTGIRSAGCVLILFLNTKHIASAMCSSFNATVIKFQCNFFTLWFVYIIAGMVTTVCCFRYTDCCHPLDILTMRIWEQCSQETVTSSQIAVYSNFNDCYFYH